MLISNDNDNDINTHKVVIAVGQFDQAAHPVHHTTPSHSLTWK